MANKQVYLTDSQLEGVKEIVNSLVKEGAVVLLKGDAIRNISEPLSNSKYLKDPYMSIEQAWATAVVSRLLASGYEIVKKSRP
jgi:hypothetical protein